MFSLASRDEPLSGANYRQDHELKDYVDNLLQF